jgi:hypothetical protein
MTIAAFSSNHSAKISARKGSGPIFNSLVTVILLYFDCFLHIRVCINAHAVGALRILRGFGFHVLAAFDSLQI